MNDIFNTTKEVHLMFLLVDAETINYKEASRNEKVNKTLLIYLYKNYRRLRMLNIRYLRLMRDVENQGWF
jgi:hypothetical protein